jgi:hypothetical protein
MIVAIVHVISLYKTTLGARSDGARRHVQTSELAFTVLCADVLNQNDSTSQVAAIRAGTIAEPVGSARTAFIDTRDIAAITATALTTFPFSARRSGGSLPRAANERRARNAPVGS